MAKKVKEQNTTAAAPRKRGRPKKTVEAAAPEAKPVEAAKASDASGMVCVALNYPTQLTFSVSNDRRVTLNGNAEALRGKSQGHIPMGGFGFTMVPAEDWEYIKTAYKSMRIFRNGLCFATTKTKDSEAEAESRASLRHGREPAAAKGQGVEATTAPIA